MIVSPSLSLEEIQERAAFFRPSANRVNETAKASIAVGEGYGQHKAYISDVALRLNSKVQSIAPLLIRFNQLGWIELVRADYVREAAPEKLAASELEYMDARFHFVYV